MFVYIFNRAYMLSVIVGLKWNGACGETRLQPVYRIAVILFSVAIIGFLTYLI